MDDAEAWIELTRAENDWRDKKVLEATLSFAHQQVGEEVDSIGMHGKHPDDPEAAAKQDQWWPLKDNHSAKPRRLDPLAMPDKTYSNEA